jgi:archaellum component FlaC
MKQIVEVCPCGRPISIIVQTDPVGPLPDRCAPVPDWHAPVPDWHRAFCEADTARSKLEGELAHEREISERFAKKIDLLDELIKTQANEIEKQREAACRFQGIAQELERKVNGLNEDRNRLRLLIDRRDDMLTNLRKEASESQRAYQVRELQEEVSKLKLELNQKGKIIEGMADEINRLGGIQIKLRNILED